MLSSESSQQFINRANDQASTAETESIKKLDYVIKFVKGISTAKKEMCPSCKALIMVALSEEEPKLKLEAEKI